ncbi:hypothetical protein [Nostoc sp.]|uniref:hypothetical protein n=1 Tax=Nostoc sp. TaxID=1180 RepID=UPI002FF69000
MDIENWSAVARCAGREDIDQYREIRSTIAKLTDLLRDINAQTEDIHSESEFERLVNAIAQRLDE